MRRSILPVAFAALLLATSSHPTAATPSAEDQGAAAITREALMTTDTWLAAPQMAGRLAGSPQYLRAAHEMARRFAAAGLAPAGDDGFFQHLDIEYNDIRTCRLAVVEANGARRPLRIGPDYTCRGLTGSATIENQVVFAGYGMSWPERGYDDYAGLDVRGKIVLVFKDAPPFQVDSTGWGARTLTRPRQRAAAAHGALALLIVPAPNQAHPQRPIASMLEGPGPENSAFPALQIDVPVAEGFATGAGHSLRWLQSAIDSTHAPHSLALPARVRVEVQARYTEKQGSLNVVGRIEGSDPALRGQCVVVGAHLDHVGRQDGLTFRGANDNASGAASVLEIARAFARTGERPRRTVIFALFSSEESGLFGSLHFVEHPPVPRDSIVAYLNLDCVAVGDSIEVGGGKTWTRMWALAHAADERESRHLMNETGPGGGADAAPFSDRGIPIAYFASHPSYTHLHLPSDTPETLNPALFESLARTAFRTAWAIAQGAPTRE